MGLPARGALSRFPRAMLREQDGVRDSTTKRAASWPPFSLSVPDHSALAGNRPSARNIALIPRTAWRRRSRFSIRAKRTWSSP